jgi:hypothetical protein
MTSTPPTVRQAYAKIGFICLLDYFAFLTRSFTHLFGAAQDHNTIAGRDTASSMPSWTWREDPTAMTRCRSFSFIVIWNRLKLSNLMFWFLFSWTWISCCCVYIPVYSTYFGVSLSKEAAKTDSSKKIRDYIRLLPDEYMEPRVRSAPRVYSSVACHRRA